MKTDTEKPKVAPQENVYMVNTKTQENVPLKSIEFNVDVYGSRLAQIEMVQSYENVSQDTPWRLYSIFLKILILP